jgi:hypothetical protein
VGLRCKRFGSEAHVKNWFMRYQQRAPGLIGITRALRPGAELGGIKVESERDSSGHGDLQTGDRYESHPCRSRESAA